MKRSILFALVLLSLSSLAFSQGFGTIVGTVADPSSAVVAGAKVTVTDPANGTSRDAVTNTGGNFVIPALRPSTYTLTVEAPGFNKYSQANILLTADQSVTVSATLTLGQANQTITVETSVVQTDTYTSTIKEVVDQQRIVDLPLNGRNAAALTTLVPGAVITPNGGADQGNTKTFPGAITISTNGSRGNMVAYNLDGGNNVDGYTNVNMPFPFPDALQEFSVQTANYTAEYGGNAGGVVNVVTKSGTNAIHGDAFGFLRNGEFNARNYFSRAVDPLKRGQEGGTIGGRIKKDKTFFFGGYQGTTIRSVSNGKNSGTSFVPTPAERNGDFSAFLNANDPSNPLKRVVILNDPTTKAPFAGNIIPTNRLDKAALGTLKYLPNVSGTGTVFYSSPLHQNFNEFLGRIDHNISDKDRVTARYYYNRFSNAPVYSADDILSYADGSQIVTENALIQEVHIFSPSLLNDFRAAYSRAAARRGPADGVPSVRDLGVNIPYQPVKNDIQSINVSGFFSFGDNPDARFTRNNFLWSDDLRWVHGRHSLSVGADIERRRVDLDNGFNSPGLFTFNGAASDKNFTGLTLADFMIGDLGQFQQSKGQFENTRVWAQGYYIQDNFKVSSRVTLNLGLRWEPYLPWHEIKDRVEGFSIANYSAGIHSKIYTGAPPGLLFRGDAGLPENGTGNNYKDFAPRVGFAWDVMGDGKTSIRGGTGMFYDTRSTGILNNNMVTISPFSPTINLNPPPGPFSFPLAGQSQYQNVFPGVFPPPSNVVFPLPISAQTFNLGSSSFQVPVIYNWNMAVEHQFGTQWLGRLAFVGSHASHLTDNIELNPAKFIPGSTLSADARRLFIPYSSIPQTDASGNSHYNSLQFTAQKRMSHGFSILANYTWQKSIDDVPPSNSQTGATNTGGGSNPPYPWYVPGSRQLDSGLSDFNRQHVFVLSYVWQLPMMAHRNGIVRNVLGDWQVTGIIQLETGLPLTVFAGTDRSGTNLNSDRADYLGTPARGDNACSSTTQFCVSWLNPTAYALPAAGTYGNAGKGAVIGPGLFNWDMGLFKGIRFSERLRAQFRAEFFNTLNHTNLTNATNNYPVPSKNSAGFGTITSAADPRIIQLALKITF